MKQTLLLVGVFALATSLSAQQLRTKSLSEPIPTPASATETHGASVPVYPQPLYYNDVTITSSPNIDQRDVRLTVAFNGWVYAAYSTYDSTSNSGGLTIRMSRDNGQTWSTIDSYSVPGVLYPTHDILVCGTDTNSLVLYNVGVNHNVSGNSYVLFVDRYNATSGVFIGSNFNQPNGTRPVYDVALATDYMFPAVNATPYSVGLLYSTYSASYDSICFVGSIDGGVSWTVRQMVATTGGYNRKVSLAYGRSSSASNGRYFAAWEQLGSSNARTGHIFTSRNQSTVDGGWIPKVNLDSVSSTMINLCRDPEIAVQYNNTDNDSASCTAVVTVSRDYNGDGSDYDLLGFYNKRAHYTNYWYRFDLDNSGTNCMQPDVSYDPAFNNFLTTYYDSTNGRLPYLVTGYNLLTPNAWTSISTQYNDVSANLKAPYPRVEINPMVSQVAHAWNAEGVLGRGVAMFDAEYVVAGVNNSTPRGGNTIPAYPNPVTDLVTVAMSATGTSLVNVYNSNGDLIESRTTNESTLQLDATAWSAGMYTVEVINGALRSATRIAVQH